MFINILVLFQRIQEFLVYSYWKGIQHGKYSNDGHSKLPQLVLVCVSWHLLYHNIEMKLFIDWMTFQNWWVKVLCGLIIDLYRLLDLDLDLCF